MTKRIIAALLVVMMAATGCSWNNKTKGAVIGGATGAAVGGAIGSQSGNTAVGAILGAAVGGADGAYIGKLYGQASGKRSSATSKVPPSSVWAKVSKITFDSGPAVRGRQVRATTGEREEPRGTGGRF